MRKVLGGHVSISGGVSNAPERARAVTCDCMQIFSKNKMQWASKPLDLEDADLYKANMEAHTISETVIHDSYLINLGSPDKTLLKQSREAFLDEVVRAKHLGVRNLIFHPGAHMGAGEQAGLKRIAESLNWVRRETGQTGVRFVLENTAGQGTVLGHSFEQLAKVIDMLDDQKEVGVCFDTCHAYAAGYDVKTRKGYEKTFETFDRVLGVGMMRAMHINDSKGKMGSHLDRHEQIGDGMLGLGCFKHFMNDERWGGIPMVLETPLGEKGYKRELKALRALIED
jgi:deoxyribonuclease-4